MGPGTIRLSVGKLTGARLPWDAGSTVDLVDQGDRMVRCYENWLLDDEQKQMFSLQPQVMFILYASSYLCDIGLTDGEGLPPRTKDFKDDRARAFFNQSLSTRSCQLIRDAWQDLGIPDRTFVDIIARVCLQAGAADSGNFRAAESEAPVIDGAMVNVPLLSACLQLCKVFDLKSPDTVLQIISHMPEDNRISPDRLEAYFSLSSPFYNERAISTSSIFALPPPAARLLAGRLNLHSDADFLRTLEKALRLVPHLL